MELKDKVIALRQSASMNRREFCDYFNIPYRTMTDWEAGKRVMPEYLFDLMEYKVKMDLLGGAISDAFTTAEFIPDFFKSGKRLEPFKEPEPVTKTETKPKRKYTKRAPADKAEPEKAPQEEFSDFRNDSAPWIMREDNVLREMAESGASLSDISRKLKRSGKNIERRLAKLGIKLK